MFKNWFRSTNEKRLEEQIAKLREDVTALQTKISLLEKRSVEEKATTVEKLFNVLEPRDEPSNVLELSNVIEQMVVSVVTPIIEEEPAVVPTIVVEPVVVKEEPAVVVLEPIVEEKTIKEEPVVVVEPVVVKEEKETNTAPKKRRQSKKAAQLEEALPK